MKIKVIFAYSYGNGKWKRYLQVVCVGPRFSAVAGEYSAFFRGDLFAVFNSFVCHHPDFITLNAAVLRGNVSVPLFITISPMCH
jgi:hypothetical protein